MSETTTALEVFLRVRQEAQESGCTEKEVIRNYVHRLNERLKEAYAATPYSQRILLLPQCLRRPDCPAPLTREGYQCQRCTPTCQANLLAQEAQRLGYKGVFILSGGSMVPAILSKTRPSAVMGISCEKEALLGGLLLQEHGIPGQGVLLLRDGCVNTQVDMKEALAAITLNSPKPSSNKKREGGE